MNDFSNMKPAVSATDRLMVTVFLAILFHALLILGIRFENKTPEKIQKSLEIALVDDPTRAAPEEADYLAQENQIGSGSEKEISKPEEKKVPSAGEPQPVPQPAVAQQKVTKRKTPEVMTQEKAEETIVSAEDEDGETEFERPELTAAGLYQQIETLSSEISLAQDSLTKRPRIKYINSVNAHRYKAASYEKAWQNKVERIGNLNYPDQARRQDLSGSLLLAVGIRKNGTIYRIEIRRSSGHKALDDGAIRIVRLAAPFAPFPPDLAKDADVLIITRTWKFSDDSHMTTSR